VLACKSVKTIDEVPIPRGPYAQQPWLSYTLTHGRADASAMQSHDVGAFDVRSVDVRSFVAQSFDDEQL
jgi:hypothetical protein